MLRKNQKMLRIFVYLCTHMLSYLCRSVAIIASYFVIGVFLSLASPMANLSGCANWHSIAVCKIHRVGRPLCRVLISKARFIVVNKAKTFLFWATCSLQQGCKSVHDTVEIARS